MQKLIFCTVTLFASSNLFLAAIANSFDSQFGSELPVTEENLSLQLAQSSNLRDIQGHWAQDFISALTAENIIAGFPDGTFRPDEPVTRAQFAAIVSKAFSQSSIRNPVQFNDVPPNYWGYEAIAQAYSTGFMEGLGGGVFEPNQNISKVQALVALASGLDLKASSKEILNSSFEDASAIPDYARDRLAAATENNLVVNYPNPKLLDPNTFATRADVAAFIYQALVDAGRLQPLPDTALGSQYIVKQEVASKPEPPRTITANQVQELRDRILALDETSDLRQIYLGAPALSGGSPSAFGAYWGTIFGAVAYQSETRFSDEDDAAFGFGFGLGTRDTVGLEVTISSYSTIRDAFFDPYGISFKLHRGFGNDFAVAAGIENLFLGDKSDTIPSGYGVVSKIFRLHGSVDDPFSRLSLSVGLGGGRFRSEDDQDEDTVNVFGSVGLRVLEPVSIFADWTGQDLNAGLSFVPFSNLPLVITPAFQDITGNAGDGVRFSITVGGSYEF